MSDVVNEASPNPHTDSSSLVESSGPKFWDDPIAWLGSQISENREVVEGTGDAANDYMRGALENMRKFYKTLETIDDVREIFTGKSDRKTLGEADRRLTEMERRARDYERRYNRVLDALEKGEAALGASAAKNTGPKGRKRTSGGGRFRVLK